MEAAGLVLGILPLLISAAEYYDIVVKPFKRYSRFASELELYQKQLGTQKTIFRNQCVLLLKTLTTNETAKQMLKDSTHIAWQSSELDQRLARQLGESGLACKTTIDLIRTSLRVIEEKSENFGLVLQQSLPVGSVGDKAWRSRVGKKLRFSVSEQRLEKSLKGLRKLNLDFMNLAEQTSKLNDYHQPPRSLEYTPPRTEKKVEECRMIQKASARLYQALERACQIHKEHSAHFRLESQHVDVEGSGSPLVRFNMAFAHSPGGVSATLEPVWIAVDSTFELADSSSGENPTSLMQEIERRSREAFTDVSSSLKHQISSTCSSFNKKIKRSVRFAEPTISRDMSSESPVLNRSGFFVDPTLPDFCIQHDFCSQLQRCEPRTSRNKYIGYLEKLGPCKHLVYFAPPISACSFKQSVSLDQIVLRMSKRAEGDQFLQYDRLRLARQLASAVLQFHATPLLKASWRGGDVVFFDNDSLSTSLTSPHLNVQVRSSKSNNTIAMSQELTRCSQGALLSNNEGFIRNPYLFGLGVILLELAYQAPLESLRQDTDLTDGKESKHTDFFAASRLSKTIDTSLGVPYGRVVRKCLGCEFGEGTDLGERRLQAAFYKDVVCELERLERSFALLQLSS